MNMGLGFAAILLSIPLGGGLFVWFTGLATAAEINARARLIEAENARAALTPNHTDAGGTAKGDDHGA